jgi:hypothetical protein
MRVRSIWILLGVVLSTACANSPTAPTADELSVVISPTPLAVPTAGGKVVWNVLLRAVAGIGIRLDRDEMVVLDSAGVTAAQQNGFYSGCAVCSADIHVEANRSMTFSGMSAAFLGAPRPGTFRYTMYYTDDLGHALSTTVTGPVM